VRDRLLRDHGINGARVEARGAGWLAPRASNATAEGRAANRRVEALAAEG
ncbi:OmpA family protein, partial [Limimaricola sp. ASW11-118]|nr:OmpA family protein [Limimaricola litoreus]